MLREKIFNKKNLIAAFVAFIMITSILGFIVGREPGQNKLNFNGFIFVNRGEFWITKINGKQATFRNYPSIIANLSLSEDAITKLKNTYEIDATSAYNDSFSEAIALSQYEFSKELSYHFNKYLVQGFTTNTTFNKPVITCENATNQIPVIFMRMSNETKISLDKNCIIAEAASGSDFLLIKDRLLFGLHGIR